ncbi:MAG: lactate utilization protein [Desulfobacterales bacterium]|jgi:L-lactate dehydrogenase complex protein LldG
MGSPIELTTAFKAAAEKVSAIVSTVPSVKDAIAYTVDLCEKKEACQLLASGCEAPLSIDAEALCDQKQKKWIAAPALHGDDSRLLEDLCKDRGIGMTHGSLRGHLSGIDIGFTIADYGIAETGTLVIDSSDEALRLATMVSEIHVAALPMSRIRETAVDLEPELMVLMGSSPNYTAFITGASRTADIERVLALGVHGPLELHILVMEDA